MFLRHRILASTLSLSCPSIALSSVSVRPVKLGGGIGGGGIMGPKKGGIGGMGGKADGAPAIACEHVCTHTTHIATHSNERFLYLLCRFSFLPPIIDLIRIQFLPISHLWERRGSWKKEPVPGIRSGIRPI